MKFEYDFMPKGLISRFIVRQNRHIKNQDLIWRKGVILEKNNSKALVKENYGSKKIEVWAKGPFSKDLMTIIKDDFDALHERFEGLKVKKLIPCNCSKCAKSEIPHFYEYESLLRRMEKERYTVECDISYENVSVQGLLDGIFVKNISEMKTNECAKILISYSKNDVKKAEKLKFYLKQFDDVYNINVWYDGDLRCGDEWDPEIKRQLQSADLIIFLVSNSFLATGYIKDIEIKTAIERHSKNEVKLMPVILSSCNWQSKVNPLRHIISYPDKIKTVADFAIEGNEDEAWTRVIKKIEEFLDEGNL
jgi:hypothetical protein